jgi:hypothetical protein
MNCRFLVKDDTMMIDEEIQSHMEGLEQECMDARRIKQIVDQALAVHLYEHHKQRNPHFKPPTREEVEAYKVEKNLPLNVVEFMEFYESNGWRVGRNPMRDWRAAARRAAREWCKGKLPRPASPGPTKAELEAKLVQAQYYREQDSARLKAMRGMGLHILHTALIDSILRERGDDK